MRHPFLRPTIAISYRLDDDSDQINATSQPTPVQPNANSRMTMAQRRGWARRKATIAGTKNHAGGGSIHVDYVYLDINPRYGRE